MASYPRSSIIQEGAYFHVTWQCHNKEWLLKSHWAKEFYYQLLLKYKKRYQVYFYSYCFMDNHIHLSGKLNSVSSFSDFFRVVNSCFAKSFNRESKRRGQVIMDRFKSPQIESEGHFMKVMTYIDLNPKRAGKVAHPYENQFSSYHYYAHGVADPLITPAPIYLDLGATPEERQRRYREAVEILMGGDWEKKQRYSSTHFIGDPKWVLGKRRELCKVHRERRQEWKRRFEAKYGSG